MNTQSDTPRTDAAMDHLLRWENDVDQRDALEQHARTLERELNAANERNEFLRDGYAKEINEVEQIAGKALCYPWLKDDQKNFPGATEEDGVCVGEHVASTIVAELARKYKEAHERIKRLEDEADGNAWKVSPAMAQATIDQQSKRIVELEARIHRLEEAGDSAIRFLKFYGPTSNVPDSCKLIRIHLEKAMESKP